MKTVVMLTALLNADPQGAESLPNLQPLVGRTWAASRVTAEGFAHQGRNTFPHRYGPAGKRWRARGRRGALGQPQVRRARARENTILSLQPGRSPADGKAWILKVKTITGGRSRYQAFKGHYAVRRDADDGDFLILKLAFTRRYAGQARNGAIRWRMDTNWRPKGVQLDLPLEAGRIPGERLVLSAVDGFFATAGGEARTASLTSRLRGRETTRVPDTQFFHVGQTLHFQPDLAAELLTGDPLSECPPPGLRLGHIRRAANPPDHGEPAAVTQVD